MLVELSVMEQRYQPVLAVVQDGWKVVEVARRDGGIAPERGRLDCPGRARHRRPPSRSSARSRRITASALRVTDHRISLLRSCRSATPDLRVRMGPPLIGCPRKRERWIPIASLKARSNGHVWRVDSRLTVPQRGRARWSAGGWPGRWYWSVSCPLSWRLQHLPLPRPAIQVGTHIFGRIPPGVLQRRPTETTVGYR